MKISVFNRGNVVYNVNNDYEFVYPLNVVNVFKCEKRDLQKFSEALYCFITQNDINCILNIGFIPIIINDCSSTRAEILEINKITIDDIEDIFFKCYNNEITLGSIIPQILNLIKMGLLYNKSKEAIVVKPDEVIDIDINDDKSSSNTTESEVTFNHTPQSVVPINARHNKQDCGCMNCSNERATKRQKLYEYYNTAGLVRDNQLIFQISEIDMDIKNISDIIGVICKHNLKYANTGLQTIRLTPRVFLRDSSESWVDAESLNTDQLNKSVNFNLFDYQIGTPKAEAVLLNQKYPDSVIDVSMFANLNTIDPNTFDNALQYVPAFSLCIDWKGCIAKYKIENGKRVLNNIPVPMIYIGATLLYNGYDITKTFRGQETDDPIMFKSIPFSLENLENCLSMIDKLYRV